MIYVLSVLTLLAALSLFTARYYAKLYEKQCRLADVSAKEANTWRRAFDDLSVVDEFRRDTLGKIAVLVTRRPPRRRWLAVSKHVAAIAAEAWDPAGWTDARKAYWLRSLARELGTEQPRIAAAITPEGVQVFGGRERASA